MKDQKYILKAILVIAIALAFILPGAASSIVSVSSSQTIGGMMYVDDDADPSWYDATHVLTIQEGVNNASIGDTILVYNGTYNVHDEVVVNKRVDLVGESKEGVIVDGHKTTTGSVVIKVVADYVSITTFSVTGEWSCIFLRASYATIANCNLYASWIGGGWAGVDLQDSNNNIITDCNIHDIGRGIDLRSGSNNLIYRNIFKDNSYVTAFDNWPNNMWDNGTVGNYWDDYQGKDQDGDGIGDEPYTIPGTAGSQDRYPLMNPTDMTPPVTTCELEGDMEGDVYLGKVTVTLLSEDILSGVNYTMYKLDDSEYGVYEGPFVVSDNSEHTVCFYSVDNIGNVEKENPCEFAVKCIMVDIKGGLGITIIFENIGETDITNLEYNLTLDYGLILIPPGGTTNGTVDVPAGEKVQEKVPVLGFGRSDITVTAGLAKRIADVLIFLLLIKKI